MTTFTIDTDNNITAFPTPEEAAAATTAGAESLTSQLELEKLASAWPAERPIAIWNSLPGVKPVKGFKTIKAGTIRIWERVQSLGAPAKPKAEQEAKAGAQAAKGAPAKPKATKKATATKNAPKTPRKAKTGKAKNVREGSKTAQVVALLQRKNGATLAEIMEKMDWQRHYADVRIMPTCVGNPACGAGIAAMESA